MLRSVLLCCDLPYCALCDVVFVWGGLQAVTVLKGALQCYDLLCYVRCDALLVYCVLRALALQ